ncbi:hypothetical protein [Burkholderia ubonensis]|uniref:hypothetical protein n=1 Tax=Burkholderia ubonensis TaxID=101571 RepID=UPI0012F896E4|nr:hypothetical protein [Burkholderia ubonensis]
MGTPSVMPAAVRPGATQLMVMPRDAKAPSLPDIPFIPGRRLPVFRGSQSRAVLLWMGEELLVGVATKNARTITERIAGANKGMD